MESKLRNIVAKIAETAADFPPDATLRDDLNVDSVRALELVFEVEKDFSIKVPEGRYGEVRTFQDLVKLVTSIKAG
ncbi:MAG TPA: acyl carrier protein [Polyangia bacterium]|jgi:acyl carrier protein